MAVTGREGFLAALFYRNYRYLWFSTTGINTVQAIEQVVLGWLVLQLTNSASLVGAVAAVRFAGMALAPFGGALADRFNRRRMLLLLQGCGVLYAGIFILLYYTGLLQIWHIFLLVLFSGAVRGIDLATRQSMIPDTVESQHLTSGAGLFVVNQGLMTVIGAMTAGYLFDKAGAGGCFVVVASAYSLAGLALVPIRLTTITKVTTESIWRSTAEGARYIIKDRGLSALILLAAIANLFSFPTINAIMPVFVRDVLHVGASGLGRVIAAEGLGGLVGALFLSSLGRSRRKGWFLVSMALIWPTILVIFSTLRSLPIALGMMALSGIARGMDMAFIQLFLLTWSEPALRGRVMGIRMFAIVTLMLGNFLSGFGDATWGPATVIAVNATASILATTAVILWAPHLHRRPEQVQVSAAKMSAVV